MAFLGSIGLNILNYYLSENKARADVIIKNALKKTVENTNSRNEPLIYNKKILDTKISNLIFLLGKDEANLVLKEKIVDFLIKEGIVIACDNKVDNRQRIANFFDEFIIYMYEYIISSDKAFKRFVLSTQVNTSEKLYKIEDVINEILEEITKVNLGGIEWLNNGIKTKEIIEYDKKIQICTFPGNAKKDDETDLRIEDLFVDGRIIKNQDDWKKSVYPKLKQFLEMHIKNNEKYLFMFDCGFSISFICGYITSQKIIDVSIFQRRKAEIGEVWCKRDSSLGKDNYKKWDIIESDIIHDDSNDIAIVLEASRKIIGAFKHYVERVDLKIRRYIHFSLPIGFDSVKDGTHSYLLANDVIRKIEESRSGKEFEGKIHIFYAVPNTVIFYLGQFSKGLGGCLLYEQNFNGDRQDDYFPTISLPLIDK